MTTRIPKLSIRGAKKEQQANRDFDQNRRDNALTILSPDQIQGKAGPLRAEHTHSVLTSANGGSLS
jgi:hypothetical protein